MCTPGAAHDNNIGVVRVLSRTFTVWVLVSKFYSFTVWKYDRAAEWNCLFPHGPGHSGTAHEQNCLHWRPSRQQMIQGFSTSQARWSLTQPVTCQSFTQPSVKTCLFTWFSSNKAEIPCEGRQCRTFCLDSKCVPWSENSSNHKWKVLLAGGAE